ncbi:MAG: hypothetical protein IKN65_06350 [Clostridia bacterium]|nr:hypothetical protein [Clostridia bacterium]
MRYFDDKFKDDGLRSKILNLFPKDFKNGYRLYKQGKLPPMFSGDSQGWYVLDPRAAVKFNINE